MQLTEMCVKFEFCSSLFLTSWHSWNCSKMYKILVIMSDNILSMQKESTLIMLRWYRMSKSDEKVYMTYWNECERWKRYWKIILIKMLIEYIISVLSLKMRSEIMWTFCCLYWNFFQLSSNSLKCLTVSQFNMSFNFTIILLITWRMKLKSERIRLKQQHYNKKHLTLMILWKQCM